jgi:ATP-dependent DNA ligase
MRGPPSAPTSDVRVRWRGEWGEHLVGNPAEGKSGAVGDVRLDSRRAKPLGRYFPEVAAAARLLPPGLVLDGELVITAGEGVDFAALQQRLRYSSPAPTAHLAGENPASLVAFDVLQRDGQDLRAALYDDRRQVLEDLLREAPRGVGLMPMTTDPRAAGAWLRDQPPGIEGVVAKRRDQRYRPGAPQLAETARPRHD